MKNAGRPFVLILILLSTAFSTLPAAARAESNEKRVDALFERFNRGISPGIAVLAVRDGRVLLAKGYGLADLEHRIPITPDTVFDIASVSKQFTGLAVSMLIEQGKISLADDIRTYIPEMHEFEQPITIDHLVHHTSGLRDWPGTLALAGWKMHDVISFDQILDMAFHQRGLNFRPGAEYVYSNTGYNLLAETIKRITGRTFRQWTEENIFGPLDMADTHFHDDHTEIVPNRARGYVRSEEGEFFNEPDLLTALGSSSLYTTLSDLSKWVVHFLEPRICGRAVLERTLERGVLNSGRRIAYAFGLTVGRYRGLETVGHGGSWASFRTYLVHFPEQRFSVVTLLNHSPSDSRQAAFDVADIYLGGELAPRPDPGTKKPDFPTVEVPGSVLDEYVGTYRLGPAWYVAVSREPGRLVATATLESPAPMIPRTDTRFWVEDYGAEIFFARDGKGRVGKLRYRGMDCPKVSDSPVAVSPPPAELAGEYKSDELQTVYTLVEENGRLLARHRRHGAISLDPAWGDDFRGGEWFMQSVVFTRDRAGKVDGFLVTTSRSRDQVFRKR
jgi:CubicO group peptidase (beta-lactamase class C family)